MAREITTLALSALAVIGTGALASGVLHAEKHDAAQQSCTGHAYAPGEVVAFASEVDCTLTTDTGYSAGVPFDIEVVHLDGKAVEVDTANAFLAMQEAAEVDSIGLGLVSGFRTYEEQEYLYNCYINCNCNNCNLAAQPGYSNHNSGHALDLNASSPGVYDWLAANGESFGFERTVPSENWHWEWWGGGPGGGVCALEERACTKISESGRTIEEVDRCFTGGGDRQYLRDVVAGHEGGLIWTRTTENETASNYGLWALKFEVAGRFELAVFTDNGEFGQSTRAAYVVTHADGEDTVTVDQSLSNGWFPLGTYRFDTADGYNVRLDDNTGEVLADGSGGVKLMFDALDVQAAPGGPEPGDGGLPPVDEMPGSDDPGEVIGGCSTSSGGGGSLGLVFFLALLALPRRAGTLALRCSSFATKAKACEE